LYKLSKLAKVEIKLGLVGTAGSGKSYSALRLARGLVGVSGKIAVVDTENGSAKLYADLTPFFHCDIAAPFDYGKFTAAIREAESAGFDAVIVDSMSHLWSGILDFKTAIDKRGGNQYTNWSEPTKHFNDVMQCVLQSKLHVLCCFRSKTEYTLSEETNSKGRTVQIPRKVGMGAIFRDGYDYEFSTLFELAADHTAMVTKDRTGLFTDKTFQITERTGELLASWLSGANPVIGNEGTENFLRQIADADSKESLNKIGQQIKASALPESEKAIIRKVYRERVNSLA